jgi:hypothetical protein
MAMSEFIMGKWQTFPNGLCRVKKLCLSGTTEFWVDEQQCLPLMVVTE